MEILEAAKTYMRLSAEIKQFDAKIVEARDAMEEIDKFIASKVHEQHTILRDNDKLILLVTDCDMKHFIQSVDYIDPL